MDAMNKLMREKTQSLTQIAEAAQRGESQGVLAASEKLGKIETLIQRYEKLVHEILELNTGGKKSGSVQEIRRSPEIIKDRLQMQDGVKSARGNGKTIRAAFLEKIADEGIHLRQIKGTIYETQSEKRIGIAVATERQPDRWFLGLPVRGYDHAILLCQRDGGDIIDIFLPKEFFEKYGKNISQSKGQIKFNVVCRGNGYMILVPGIEGVSISELSQGYTELK